MFRISLWVKQGHWREIGSFNRPLVKYSTGEFIQDILKRFPALQIRIEFKGSGEEGT